MLSTTFEHRPLAGIIHDIGASRVLLAGKSFVADPTGAIFWPAENALIVADLRLSSCSYLDGRDVLLPPYDTASSFEKLEEALDRYDPARVLVLGNSFEDLDGNGLSPHQKDWLQDMMEARDWYWVTGRHTDPLPEGIGGEVVAAAHAERDQVPGGGDSRAGVQRNCGRAAPSGAGLSIRSCRAGPLLRHQRDAADYARNGQLFGGRERVELRLGSLSGAGCTICLVFDPRQRSSGCATPAYRRHRRVTCGAGRCFLPPPAVPASGRASLPRRKKAHENPGCTYS